MIFNVCQTEHKSNTGYLQKWPFQKVFIHKEDCGGSSGVLWGFKHFEWACSQIVIFTARKDKSPAQEFDAYVKMA